MSKQNIAILSYALVAGGVMGLSLTFFAEATIFLTLGAYHWWYPVVDDSYLSFASYVLPTDYYCGVHDVLGMTSTVCGGSTWFELVIRIMSWLFWSAVTAAVFYFRVYRRVQYWTSLVIDQSRIQSRSRVEQIRAKFHDLDLPTLPTPTHHTHPESALHRSTATAFAVTLARSQKLNPYFVQMSRSNQRYQHDGSRIYHWPKDLTCVPSEFKTDRNDLVILIDVDYYIDVNALLSTLENPVIMYTLVPEAVAETNDEYSFTFNEADEVIYSVSGGAQYKHQLWNHAGDSALITTLDVKWDSWWDYFKSYVYPRCTAYNVETRRISKHHSMVLYAPIGHWVGFPVWLLRAFHGMVPKRLRVCQGKYLRLNVSTEKGLLRSTGIAREYNHATVPASIDSQIRTLADTSVTKLTPASVQRYVDDHATSVLLANYHRNVVDVPADTVVSAETAVRSYQFLTSQNIGVDPDAKPSLVAFMSPLVHAAFSPDRCYANDNQAVVGRVTSIASDLEESPNPRLGMFVSEFALFVSRSADLVPDDHDIVYDRQTRPSQRALLSIAELACRIISIIKSFVKVEAYGKPTDPRLISTIVPEDKMEYSRYIYPLMDHIKTFPWYAFGRTPKEIAERVSAVCQSAETHVNLTDMSRMDGRVSKVVRDMEETVITACFRAEYVPELLELMRRQYGLRGYTSFGVRYDTGTSRCSGSPETSVSNTLLNAFIAFVALRTTMSPYGCRYTADEAWSRLGIYGGDDGLTADVDPRVYAQAAASLGQLLTDSTVAYGGPGVMFLARCYGPDVWFGDTNSCCDLLRTLSKIHTTKALPPHVPPADKLVAKAQALALTDPETPIVGALALRVLELDDSDRSVPEMEGQVSWWVRYNRADQFPNFQANWMLSMVEQLDLDINRFERWIERVGTLDELLSSAPLLLDVCPVLDAVAPMVIDGAVVIPKTLLCPEHPLGAHLRNECKTAPRLRKMYVPPADTGTMKDRAKTPPPVSKPVTGKGKQRRTPRGRGGSTAPARGRGGSSAPGRRRGVKLRGGGKGRPPGKPRGSR